ncbi:MAG: hypothetical protein J6K92_12250 [Oscillospiraceae bacterium]|nr:hypothetical protein [Oscillospiraceae bacterium]
MISVIISLIITAFAVGYFISDCRGKLNGEYIGTGVIYLIFPLLHALAIGISSAVLFGIKPDFGIIDDDTSWKKIIYIIICIVIAVPELIVSVIGAVRFIGKNRRLGFSDAHYRLSMISAVLCIPFGAAAMAFAVMLCIGMISYISLGMLAILFIGLFTFCIGFVIVIVLFPFIMAYWGVSAVIGCLPAINITLILGAVFCIFYLIAAYGGISSAVSLCREGKISKKRAVLYSVLSLFMFTNIFALSQMKAK